MSAAQIATDHRRDQDRAVAVLACLLSHDLAAVWWTVSAGCGARLVGQIPVSSGSAAERRAWISAWGQVLDDTPQVAWHGDDGDGSLDLNGVIDGVQVHVWTAIQAADLTPDEARQVAEQYERIVRAKESRRAAAPAGQDGGQK